MTQNDILATLKSGTSNNIGNCWEMRWCVRKYFFMIFRLQNDPKTCHFGYSKHTPSNIPWEFNGFMLCWRTELAIIISAYFQDRNTPTATKAATKWFGMVGMCWGYTMIWTELSSAYSLGLTLSMSKSSFYVYKLTSSHKSSVCGISKHMSYFRIF